MLRVLSERMVRLVCCDGASITLLKIRSFVGARYLLRRRQVVSKLWWLKLCRLVELLVPFSVVGGIRDLCVLVIRLELVVSKIGWRNPRIWCSLRVPMVGIKRFLNPYLWDFSDLLL